MVANLKHTNFQGLHAQKLYDANLPSTCATIEISNRLNLAVVLVTHPIIQSTVLMSFTCPYKY